MAATDFQTTAKGATAAAAFNRAVADARHEYGHGGYTGTIAEKTSFIEIPVPPGVDPSNLVSWILYDGAERLVPVTPPADWNGRGLPPGATMIRGYPVTEYFRIEMEPPPAALAAIVTRYRERTCDKWGSAGAVRGAADAWIFFGMAPS